MAKVRYLLSSGILSLCECLEWQQQVALICESLSITGLKVFRLYCIKVYNSLDPQLYQSATQEFNYLLASPDYSNLRFFAFFPGTLTSHQL